MKNIGGAAKEKHKVSKVSRFVSFWALRLLEDGEWSFWVKRSRGSQFVAFFCHSSGFNFSGSEKGLYLT